MSLTVSIPKRLSILPLRDIVIFPQMTTPLFVGRPQSLEALAIAETENDRYILLVTQIAPETEENNAKSLHKIGTVAKITQKIEQEDGSYKILTESLFRVKLKKIMLHQHQSCSAEYTLFADKNADHPKHQDLLAALKVTLNDFIELSERKQSEEIYAKLQEFSNINRFISVAVSNLPLTLTTKQNLLEIQTTEEQAEQLLTFIELQIDQVTTEKRIRARVKAQIEKNQREYFLNEQMKVIHKELDELNGGGLSELDQIKHNIEKAQMPKAIEAKALSEFKKLKSMPAMSSEGAVIRNYVDWLLKMPWKKRATLNTNIRFAQTRLDRDHFGLDKVKERILDYLSVLIRSKSLKSPIICLIGPPGVGKTTLARSIAESTGREFIRISLGGVRDESEIRGHRRTYIGAMPGRLVQALAKLNTKNPLILLDEIDKMGSDMRGDPASALLEVLDPEQNNAFNDHYLDVDLDLSEIMFITTANSYNIPAPLRDRMEIINIAGYTELEKLDIARRYLLPKQMTQNGLKEGEISIEDKVLLKVIRHYTKEAGVRNLERLLGTLSRKVVKYILSHSSAKFPIKITMKKLDTYLGVALFNVGMSEKKSQVGYVNGLAWTEFGGDLLGIEVEIMPGTGALICTGSLGEVMKESMRTAMTVVRVRAKLLNLPDDFHNKWDLHIHAPEGAVPKDGPSAGIAITTAIISALTGNPIKADIAMTGEVTLRGKVLPIGGLKEKLLAAGRGEIKTVLIPKQNEKDLIDIPNEITQNLTIYAVSEIEEVLNYSLVQPIDFEKNKIEFKSGIPIEVSNKSIV